tara:strand:+ start:244 stop:1035 length:792 start_codon:yes stop_codon:yes gene_type:complete
MAYKMKGSPAKLGTIQGTAGHASALKKASALKLTYKEAYAGLSDEKKAKQTEAEFIKEAKAWNTKKYGTTEPTRDAKKQGITKEKLASDHKASQEVEKEGEKVDVTPPPKKEVSKIEKKATDKKEKIQTKADRKKGEIDENLAKKQAKKDVKTARKTHGRGSKEHTEAKLKREKAKHDDLTGAKGGKKTKFLGKWRKKRSEKKIAKLEAKLSGTDNKKKKVKTNGEFKGASAEFQQSIKNRSKEKGISMSDAARELVKEGKNV